MGTLGPGPHKQRAASGTLAPLSAQNELIGVYSGTATTVNMFVRYPCIHRARSTWYFHQPNRYYLLY